MQRLKPGGNPDNPQDWEGLDSLSLPERRRLAALKGYRTAHFGENIDGERVWALWDSETNQWVGKGKQPAEFATEAEALACAEALC